MADFAWFAKRVFIVAFVVGMFWNDSPIGEELGVYMILLSGVFAVGWIVDAHPSTESRGGPAIAAVAGRADHARSARRGGAGSTPTKPGLANRSGVDE